MKVIGNFDKILTKQEKKNGNFRTAQLEMSKFSKKKRKKKEKRKKEKENEMSRAELSKQ